MQVLAGPRELGIIGSKVAAWRAQIAEAIEEDPLVDSTRWANSVDELLADLPNFHENLSLMMSGLIAE